MNVFRVGVAGGTSRLKGARRARLVGGHAESHPSETGLGSTSLSTSWEPIRTYASEKKMKRERLTRFGRCSLQSYLFNSPIGQTIWTVMRRYCHTEVRQNVLDIVEKSKDLFRAHNELVIPSFSESVCENADNGRILLSNGIRVDFFFEFSLNVKQI